MELKIDPEAVNKLVADAVLNSAIGEAVKKAVEKEIANLNRGYDNPLESVVRNHVAEIVRTVLREEHGEAIKARLHNGHHLMGQQTSQHDQQPLLQSLATTQHG